MIDQFDRSSGDLNGHVVVSNADDKVESMIKACAVKTTISEGPSMETTPDRGMPTAEHNSSSRGQGNPPAYDDIPKLSKDDSFLETGRISRSKRHDIWGNPNTVDLKINESNGKIIKME